MYKSILASALITLSASNAFAFGWLDQINQGVADQAPIHFKQQQFNDIFNRQATAHRRNGATNYNAHTYAAFNASEAIGYDGSGINILVKDFFSGEHRAHGPDVSATVRIFAPGANITDIDARNFVAEEYSHYNQIINESFSNNRDTLLPGQTLQEALQYFTYSNGQYIDPLSLTDVNTLRNRRNNSKGLYVIAAGNESRSCSTLYDCNFEAISQYADGADVIAVGALNAEGTALAGYSNEAGLLKDIFLSAPVASINGSQGTSLAAPVVTAAAALVMDQFGTSTSNTLDILLNTADDLGAPGTDAVFGRGRLNVHRALSPIGALR